MSNREFRRRKQCSNEELGRGANFPSRISTTLNRTWPTVSVFFSLSENERISSERDVGAENVTAILEKDRGIIF